MNIFAEYYRGYLSWGCKEHVCAGRSILEITHNERFVGIPYKSPTILHNIFPESSNVTLTLDMACEQAQRVDT